MVQISKVEIIEAIIPRKSAFEISRGTFVAAKRIFVRVTLENGVTGYGECATLEGRGEQGTVALYSEETSASAREVLEHQIGPAVAGMDALNMAEIHRMIASVSLMNPQAKAGIDMAIYDAVGKSLKVPVHALLGGAYRLEIPLAQSVGVKTDQEVVDGSKRVMDQGFKVIKLKGGRDIKEDIKRIGLIRKSVSGDFPIRLDANAGYASYDQIILPLKQAEALGLDELEQPLGRFDLRGMKRLATELHTPLLADESMFFAHDAANIIQMEAADVINIKVQKAGGLFPAIRIDHAANASKVGVLVGALQETGIGTAASLHLAAACKVMSCASDCRTHLVYEHTLLRNELIVKNGIARVPEEPGLGIEVDEQALGKFARGGWKTVGERRR
jgi:L-alanine-DL-glutamate epimerase-like enolase superfamily enzyme